MSDSKKPSLLRDGVMGGVSFATAVGILHLAFGIGLILATNMPPLTWFAAKSVLIELCLGPVFGLLLSPLLLAPRGRWAHTVGLAAAWIGMEFYVTIDPTSPQMWAGPSLGALLMVAIGRKLWARSPAIPVALSVALPSLLLAIPLIRTAAVGGVASVDRSDRPVPPSGSPDVVFVVIDTVRAESVSAYGYERNTTPNFDAMAAEGVLFEKAISPAIWSLPAHASLFTGQFPSAHGTHLEHRYLDDELPTIAEKMADAGWQTLAFTANTHISESFGLTRGFDWTDQAWITGAGGRGFTFIYRFVDALGFAADDKGGAQVAKNVEDWMAKRPADDGPAFVFVNFLEAHFPFHQLPDEFLYEYTDEDESTLRDASQIAFGAMFGRPLTDDELEFIHQPILDMYDSGVKYSDHLMGRVLKTYEDAGRLDNTIFIVLGDHGEMTGEHGSHGHATALYEQTLHVPFAIRYPSRIEAGATVSEPVSTAGLYATILDLVGLPLPEVPSEVHVGTLMPALEGQPAGQPIISERFEEDMLLARLGEEVLDGIPPMHNPRGRFRVYRSGDMKLVMTTKLEHHFYNLAKDPGEDADVLDLDPEVERVVQELQAYELGIPLPAIDAALGEMGDVPELDAAAEEQLRALGYIE